MPVTLATQEYKYQYQYHVSCAQVPAAVSTFSCTTLGTAFTPPLCIPEKRGTREPKVSAALLSRAGATAPGCYCIYPMRLEYSVIPVRCMPMLLLHLASGTIPADCNMTSVHQATRMIQDACSNWHLLQLADRPHSRCMQPARFKVHAGRARSRHHVARTIMQLTLQHDACTSCSPHDSRWLQAAGG